MKNLELSLDAISIREFIETKRQQGRTENDINWELKDYINSLIGQAESIAKQEVDKAHNEEIIDNKEWFEAHSLLNTVWFDMRSIISDMWFQEELMLPNAEELFMNRAEEKFMYKLRNIESENLRNFLL